jgi:PqqD family protein of HPr-rel-A system
VVLHWRCWDDEWAVFDVGSGMTYQMDTLTAVALMTVEAGSTQFEQLLSSLSDDLLIPNDQTLVDVLNGVLNQLAAAGLVRSTSL